MEPTDLIEFTACELANSLKNGEASAVEIAQSFISRTKDVDEQINAFLHLDEEDMLEQAKQSDERRSKGKALSSLDGIPVGMKDVICVEGQPLTAAVKS